MSSETATVAPPGSYILFERARARPVLYYVVGHPSDGRVEVEDVRTGRLVSLGAATAAECRRIAPLA